MLIDFLIAYVPNIDFRITNPSNTYFTTPVDNIKHLFTLYTIIRIDL